MSSNDANDRKRKPATMSETISSSDEQNPKERKARRVSTTNVSASTATSLQVDTTVVTENATTANATSAATEDEDTIRSIGKMIQDLFHSDLSDNAKANAALDALHLDLNEDKKKFPACDQITTLNELAELSTLIKTLNVIIRLTYRYEGSKVGIAAIGGVEAVVKVIKTFPKCQILQVRACWALLKLAFCNSIGKVQVVESGGIEVILAAINNHLGSAIACENACRALYIIVHGSKEYTELLLTLGGGAAVAKVRRKWMENDKVQTQVRKMANLFAAEWQTCADEDEA